MPRQPILALGLLALLFAVGRPASSAITQGPGAAKGARGPTAATPVTDAAHPRQDAEAKFESAAEATQPGQEGADMAHGKSPNIMEVQAPLAIWTLVVFLLLMAVLGRYAWKPLMKALHEREAHLENVLLDTERARNEAEAQAAEHRRQLGQAADEVRALIEQARKEAAVAGDSIVRKAQAEAEAARDRATREIAGAKDQALMEIWSQTADLAVSVAGRVLEKELGESDHRRLVEVAMGELPANGRGVARS